MARGKHTCKILKEIRRQIAEANGIEFITSECRYKGDCSGTCPKCEAEVRYLEEQLRARSIAGKAVALAGISAGMIFMSGCGGTSSSDSSGDSISDSRVEMADSTGDDRLSGEPESCSATEEDSVMEIKESETENSSIFKEPLVTDVGICGEVVDTQWDSADDSIKESEVEEPAPISEVEPEPTDSL